MEDTVTKGVPVALGLMISVLVVLPREARIKLVGSLIWFLLYAICLVPLHTTVFGPINKAPFAYGGLFFLLCCCGHSLFLIVVKSRQTRTLFARMPRILLDLILMLVYVAAFLVTLEAVGMDPASLVASSAVLTAAIGFLMKDTLGNIFSGLAIQMERPFEVGDWIQYDTDERHVGEVLEINWRGTRLLTNDQALITVPNGLLSQAAIINFTKPQKGSQRCIYVPAPNNVPPHKVHRIIIDCLDQMPGLAEQPPTHVVTNKYTERGMEYWVSIYIAEFHLREQIDGEARDRIWYAFQRNGITIPPLQHHVQTERWDDRRHKVRRRRGQSRRRSILAKVDFLKNLPEDALDRLSRRAKRKSYAKGESLIRQGDQGTELFILMAGEVSILVAKDGQSVAVDKMSPPAFFGEMSLLTGESRTATVVAERHTECLVIDKPAMSQVLQAAPALAEQIGAVLERRRANQLEKMSATNHAPLAQIGQRADLVKIICQFFAL